MKKIKFSFAVLMIAFLFCSCSAKGTENQTTSLTEISQSMASVVQESTVIETSQTVSQTATQTETITTAVETATVNVTETTTQALSTTKKDATTKKQVTSKKETTTQKQTTTKKQVTTQKATKPQPTTVKQTTTKPHTTTKPQTKPTPKPTTTVATTKPKSENFCYITIDIKTIKNNLGSLKKEKLPFVTGDGYILKKTKVELKKNDTAFDVLKRACKENKCTDGCKYCKNGIMLESSYTPAFQSYYIEGIHQLYEMDCGSLSGWMFSVNGEFPDVSASSYQVKKGDSIVFVYTCDMGEDIGNGY